MPAHPDPIDDLHRAAPPPPAGPPPPLDDQPALLAAVVGNAPVGLALFDAELRCLQINQAMAELQGVPATEVLGRTPAQYLPQAWSIIEPLFQRARTEPVATVEIRGAQRATDGRSRWWLASAYGVPLPGGSRGVAVVASDITDRKRAEQALAEREAELSSLFSSIDEGFCVCEIITDAAGTAVDYRFVEVNPLFESMTGLVDAAGRRARDLVPDLEQQWVDTYTRVGLGRETLRFQQGSQAMGRWFDVFATPLEPVGRFAVVFKDLTEHHRWELQLQESEERFRTMADELPLLVWQHDANGALEWVNATYCSYFGVSRTEMRDDRWQPLLHPDDAEAYSTAYRAAVAERRAFNAEVRVRRRDGQWRWIESWARPRFAYDGSFVGHIGTSADITERRELAESLASTATLNAFRAQLSDLLRTLSDPAQVQPQAARLLGEHLGAARVHYVEVEPDGRHGVVGGGYHPGAAGLAGRLRLDEYGPDVTGELHAGRTVAVDDVDHDPRLDPAQRADTAARGVGSYVLVPLVKQGRTAALLAVHHRRAHRWSDDELTAAAEAAERIWAAMERARHESTLRIRQARAELVADLLAGLETQPTVDGQLQYLAEALVPAACDYATVESPGREPHLLAAAHRDPDGLPVLRALRQRHRLGPEEVHSVGRAAAGETQLLSVITPAQRAGSVTDDEGARLLERLGPRSHMAVPLDLGGGIRGVLMLGLTDPARPPFQIEDLDFLEETAQRAGMVLAAGRLRHLQHDTSLRLQRALLPDTIQWHPNLEIEARYHAASDFLEVGGDWYDTYAWPDGRIGVIVGDVVGHNLDSAAAMGRLRAATTALAGRLGPDPATLLGALDDFARGPDGTSFATVVCVVVDPATGALTYSSAGHPPALVVSPQRAVQRLNQAQSPPLCTIHAGPWPQASLALEAGSLVVVYSDGLIERRTDSLLAGIDRLEQLAVELIDEPIAAIADELTRAMSAHSPPEDDVVVTCFRYTPGTARESFEVRAGTDPLGVLRAGLRRWLEEQGIGGRHRDDILLAVGEACTNAIEHAYHEREPGLVRLELSDHRYHLTARVTDQGSWRPPGAHSRLRGRGTGIMRTLSTRFVRHNGPDGTTVELNLSVPRRQP